MATTGRGLRKNQVGVVIGNKMDKTAVVQVSRIRKHKTYNKFIRSHSKYLAHDSRNECRVGDKVRIIETRPLSKFKRWQVVEILQRSTMPEEEGTGQR